MRPLDYIRSVRHVFATHRVRTVLTLLGIMIGSGSIVLLAGLLRGGEEALLETSQRANEADILQIRRDEPPSSQLHRTRRELSHSDAGFLSDSALLAGRHRHERAESRWPGAVAVTEEAGTPRGDDPGDDVAQPSPHLQGALPHGRRPRSAGPGVRCGAHGVERAPHRAG